MNKLACVAVVKNEAKNIAEWISYQLIVGFDTVIIMNNGSNDKTTMAVEKFSKNFDVRLLESPDNSRSYQKSAYMTALKVFGREFEWMAFFDVDEFFTLEKQFKLKNILSSFQKFNGIGVNWAIFGSSNHKSRPPGLTIEHYIKRSESTFGPNRHVKSIIRPEAAKEFINGHTFEIDGDYCDLAGNILQWESYGIIKTDPDYSVGKLNHYFTKSWEEWNAKISRGYPDLERKITEFELYDRNEVLDDSMIQYAQSIKEKIAIAEQNSVKKSVYNQSEMSGVLTNLLQKQKIQYSHNISYKKPARQSSLSPWSTGATVEEDAAGAVDGNKTGGAKFHTQYEYQPWWIVDLQDIHGISEIRIYNRCENAELAARCSDIQINIGLTEEDMICVFEKKDGQAFGGLIGQPLKIQPKLPYVGRYVKIVLLGLGYLHFDQVEIFGSALSGESTVNYCGHLSDVDLVGKFQSLGDNCEFGGVQRQLGLERLELLKWCRTTPDVLSRGLTDGFNSLGDVSNVELVDHLGEYFIRDRKYDISGHTFIKIGSIDEEKFRFEQARRLRYLRERFMEDIMDAEKVLIYNSYKLHEQPSADSMIALGNKLAEFGDNYLVWARDASLFDRMVGEYSWISERVLMIFKDQFSTFDSTPEQYMPGWLEVCRTAYREVLTKRG